MLVISGGHQIGGGANGLLNETVEDRKIVGEIIRLDNTIVDVSINNNVDADTELVMKVNKVNALCTSNKVDCYADIHLNAFNGQAKGVECIILGYSSGLYANKDSYNENYNKAKKVCEAISRATGLYNRGVKENNEFYVLSKPLCHSMIVEVCFLDNAEDVAKYNYSTVAKAIIEGLKGEVVIEKPIEKPIENPQAETILKEYSEEGKCTICVKEGVYFYNKPYISEITGSYEYEESVNYDYVVITNKYVYISWISASARVRRYMPVLDKSSNKRWGNCI